MKPRSKPALRAMSGLSPTNSAKASTIASNGDRLIEVGCVELVQNLRSVGEPELLRPRNHGPVTDDLVTAWAPARHQAPPSPYSCSVFAPSRRGNQNRLRRVSGRTAVHDHAAIGRRHPRPTCRRPLFPFESVRAKRGADAPLAGMNNSRSVRRSLSLRTIF